MEQFIGCDAHKKFSVFVAVNEKGHAGEAMRVAHDRQLYREFLGRLPPHSMIAVEASGHYSWLVDEMERLGHYPKLANPLEAKRRMALTKKTDKLDARGLAILLRNVGHEVRIEHDGLAAIKELTRELPDVVLLDIGLPGISGYEVAKRLRQHPGGESVRIYAMTGYGQEDDRRRSMEAGFDGHLVKPVIPSDLFALVDAAPRPH